MDGTRAGVRTKNIHFMVMTRDVSRLRGWLNADAPCRVTPRHVEGDTGGWDVRGRVAAVAVLAACTEEPTGHWARRTHGGGREGTINILYMVVTLDVSQLETSSSKVFKFLNRSLMSVIDETTQPEIGPYALRAAARSLTHSWTAACRVALVEKVLPPPGAGAAQTSHPLAWVFPSDNHVKALLPSTTPLGPVVPLYVTPFTISLSWLLSVLKAVALRR